MCAYFHKLVGPNDRRTGDNIYRRLETEPTAMRSIVIHTREFLPTFHSPAMGSGRHHSAVMSPPAAGRIIECVNLLNQPHQTKDDTVNN
ncbi:hypothetical protein C6502_04770 [Candidatus Poribacteria bacterium]|nr:MAG: hypothetical protein C6502_04770 [Candidatus Poribacteria bacterium]